VIDLLAAIREGEVSPPLWHLILRALSFCSDNFLAVSLLHWSIMVAAMAILMWYAPFRRVDKLLMSLGYYLFYEYTVVVRHYGLTVLLIFAFLAVSARPRARAWAPLLLALLAQTNVLGVFFAAALWPLSWRWPERSPAGQALVLLSMLVAAYYLGGLGASVASGAGRLPTETFSAHALNTFSFAARSFWIPIVNTGTWWPQRMLECWWLTHVAAAFALAAIVLLAPRRPKLRMYYAATGLALMALYLAMRGAAGVRHFGFMQIFWWTFLWLDGADGASQPPWRTIALRVLLLGSVWGSVGMIRLDWSHPYSMARATGQEVARIMEEDGERRVLWATLRSGQCEGVLAFLPRNRAEFFSLELEEPYRYLVHKAAWKRAEGDSHRLGGEEMLNRLTRELRRTGYVRAYVLVAGEAGTAQLSPRVFLIPRRPAEPEHIQIEDEQFVIHDLMFAMEVP
jgi:hypothetical protein